MSEELKPCEHGRNFCMDCHYPKGKFKTLPAMYDGLAAENQRLRTELAALKATQGDSVAWRDHSVNHAKGEKCPATIETLQAAWDRDQELLLDQKNVISKLKETINQLRQKRTTRPTATIQGEANRRPQTCNGRSCSWCKEGAEPCHYTAAAASADAVSVPVELLMRLTKRVMLRSQEEAHADACDELRALLARQEVK